MWNRGYEHVPLSSTAIRVQLLADQAHIVKDAAGELLSCRCTAQAPANACSRSCTSCSGGNVLPEIVVLLVVCGSAICG